VLLLTLEGELVTAFEMPVSAINDPAAIAPTGTSQFISPNRR